jgi:hypothetical protein
MKKLGLVLALCLAQTGWAQLAGNNTQQVHPVTISAVPGLIKSGVGSSTARQEGTPLMYAVPEEQIRAAKLRSAARSRRSAVPAPDRAVSGLQKTLGPVVGASFEGIGFTGYDPPDPVLAAGPTNIVEAVNLSIRITDKAGTLQYENTLAGWFSGVTPPANMTDPKVVFDPLGQRFIVLVLGSDQTAQISSYLIAVSQSSNAMGNWYLYKLDAKANGTENSGTWADFPGLGFDSTAVYVTSNQYTFTTPKTFQYAKLRIIDKARMYAGLSVGWYDLWDFANEDGSTVFTLKPAQTLGRSSIEWLLNTEAGGGSTVTVWSVEEPLSGSPIVLLEGTLDIGTYDVPPDAAQQGGANLISTTDCRTQDVVWRNNFLYTTFTEAYDWGSGTVSAIRVLKIDTELGEVAQNQIFGAEGYYYFFPAAFVNSADVMHVVFNRSGSAEYVGVRAVTEVWNDASSSEVKKGIGYYAGTRWGDYSGIGMDPSGTIWVAGEYATASSSAWGTWIAALGGSSTPSVTVTSPNGGEIWVAGTSRSITWTSNGFTSARIQYSTNNGSSWTDVTPGTPAGAGSYAWTIPGTTSTQCLVKVSDAADGSPSDQSNGVFTIAASQPGGHFVKIWSGTPFVAMNIYVTGATVDGSSLAAGDEIGIFDGSACVGAATVAGPISTSSPLAMVAATDDPTTPGVDGFTPGHAISFRLWKGGTETSAVTPTYAPPTPIPTFTSLGSSVVSLAGISATSQTIPLTAGWNILSLTVVPSNPGMVQILQPLIDVGQLVKVQDEQGNALERLPGIGWINSIGNWGITEGYYLRVTASSSLTVTGAPAPLPLQVSLSNGWNIIGYPRSAPVNALTAFQPLITQNRLVKVQDESGNAIENLPVLGWVNNIGTLKAGEGYYLRVNGATSLTYNADGSTSKAAPVATVQGATHFRPAFTGNPFDPMNLYVRIDAGTGIAPGSELALFDGDRCVGTKVITEEHFRGGIVPIAAGMDDPATDEPDGFLPGHTVTVRGWDGKTEAGFTFPAAGGASPVFAARESGILVLEKGAGLPVTAVLLEGYPNPFNPVTTIRYSVPGANGLQPTVEPELSNVVLAVYDLLGREVAVLVQERQAPGAYEVRFNAGSLASGIYTCRVQAGTRSGMLKLALVR